MISFILCVVAIILGFIIYSRVVEKIFGADENKITPAVEINDGVDFVPMSKWKMFLIQFLNIAGLGPIFGAIAGALWGPVAFLWIVFGTIFAGGVHDYFSGMLSVRHRGSSIPEIVGVYLGNGFKQFMRVFSVVVLVLVGVVFIAGPAGLLAGLTSIDKTIWLYIIFAYFIMATLVPIDKLIGKIYPIFGAILMIMAIGVAGGILFGDYNMPEIAFVNLHPSSLPIYPLLFITIACGAISGFHSTQSPMMARCITNEKEGRMVFYGAMAAEGIVALIWAAAAMTFFGSTGQLGEAMAANGGAAYVVNIISTTLLGKVGGVLAILGVVVCPITSGDTAFRSVRLTVSDAFKINQGSIKNRLFISIPLFIVAYVLTQIDFTVLWRYFAWSNQTLATIVLWTAAMFLMKENKLHWIATIPATFMTAVVTTYIMVAPEGFQLSNSISYPVGIILAVVAFIIFMYFGGKQRRERNASLELA